MFESPGPSSTGLTTVQYLHKHHSNTESENLRRMLPRHYIFAQPRELPDVPVIVVQYTPLTILRRMERFCQVLTLNMRKSKSVHTRGVHATYELVLLEPVAGEK